MNSPRRHRYGDESPLNRSSTLGGNALRAMSRSFRRVSVRVVDLASSGSRDHGGAVQLTDTPDGPDEIASSSPSILDGALLETPQSILRGRTLGYFESDSRVRKAMYRFLVYK
jgi:hypothetical protein